MTQNLIFIHLGMEFFIEIVNLKYLKKQRASNFIRNSQKPSLRSGQGLLVTGITKQYKMSIIYLSARALSRGRAYRIKFQIHF